MQESKVMHFNTIKDLQIFLTTSLENLKKKSDEYSEAIGEKLRGGTSSNSTELADLKEKLEGTTDPKKKKVVKKKDQKSNWYNLDTVLVYEGIGTKGELEIYFKASETLKLKIEKLQKIKETIDGLVSKGLKIDLSCVALLGDDLSFELAFIKANEPKAKFAFNAIFNVGVEQIHEIKI